MIFTEIVKNNSEFLRMYRRGRQAVCPQVVVYACKNRDGSSKMGITASKKTGNAVTRNRAKRVIRAAYSQIESSVPQGWSFVFVARSSTASANAAEFAKMLEVIIKKITSEEYKNSGR